MKPLGADTTCSSRARARGRALVRIVGRQTAERGVAVPVDCATSRATSSSGDPVSSSTFACARRAASSTAGDLKLLATIDLAGAAEGERIVQLTPEQVQVPFGFRVVKITPSLLTLNLERTEHKSIPVRPRVTGRPASGFEIAGVASDPPEVRVAGPRSRVREIESALPSRCRWKARPTTPARRSASASRTRCCGSRAAAACASA